MIDWEGAKDAQDDVVLFAYSFSYSIILNLPKGSLNYGEMRGTNCRILTRLRNMTFDELTVV